MLPQVGGSYEDVPGNIVDYAKRDRRWCQGSLQHLRILSVRGLRWMSRLHFVLGAMGYVSSFLWLLMLLASTAYIVLPYVSLGPFAGIGSVLFGQVFVEPASSGMNAEPIIPLLGVTVVLLFLPKLLALTLALARQRHGFGGSVRLLSSAVLEMLFAVVVAPLMMMYHVRFVLSVLGGHGIEWETQVREGRTVAWSEAWWRDRRRHGDRGNLGRADPVLQSNILSLADTDLRRAPGCWPTRSLDKQPLAWPAGPPLGSLPCAFRNDATTRIDGVAVACVGRPRPRVDPACRPPPRTGES